MNAIENMHEVRLPNIYIPSKIICYILSLTVIIVLAIKEVVFSRSDKFSVTYLQNIMVISRIKYDFFLFEFFIISD